MTVSYPATADRYAIPRPIVPLPITAICRIMTPPIRLFADSLVAYSLFAVRCSLFATRLESTKSVTHCPTEQPKRPSTAGCVEDGQSCPSNRESTQVPASATFSREDGQDCPSSTEVARSAISDRRISEQRLSE